MSILKVAQMGHPVLRTVAAPVDPAEIPTPAFQAFLDDMLETMDAYDGAGLAAPQVHRSQRVVCLTLAGGREPEFMINPEIVVLTEQTSSLYEGCLSVEGLRGRVHRPNLIRVKFLDRTGEERIYQLKGFAAVVTQHECDHLDGVLYVDRVDTRTLAFMPEFRRFGPLDEADDEIEDEVPEGGDDQDEHGGSDDEADDEGEDDAALDDATDDDGDVEEIA